MKCVEKHKDNLLEHTASSSQNTYCLCKTYLASPDKQKKGEYKKGNSTQSQNICVNLHPEPSVLPLGATRQEQAVYVH